MAEHHDTDTVTGTQTTGHVWDGIRELNTPLPRWWLWLFYITIVWAIGYWVVYPTWPLISSFSAGTFGWSSREAVATEIDTVKASASVTLGSNLEQLILTGTSAVNGTGNTLANTLTGNGAANALSAGGLNDTLIGGAGDDTLTGVNLTLRGVGEIDRLLSLIHI